MFKKSIKNYLSKSIMPRLIDHDTGFEVKENDIFIASYPKSGNTWMRFLLANLIYSKQRIDFANIEDFIVDIYKRKNNEIKRNNDINIFKTHSYFRPKFTKYKSNKVVYIVRDVRDVIISYYQYVQKRKNTSIEFNDFYNQFLAGDIDNYGTWGENVGSWLGASKGNSNFLLIKYEDMLEDIYSEMIKVCDFLDLNVNKSELTMAIEKSSFDNLQKSEVEVQNKAEELKNTNQNIKFFRSGKKGQWNDYLTKKQIEILESQYSNLLKKLGYIQ
ncbi:sulfotransferase domain-containing protein [Salinibacillus aidingensis]|uniref:Sulfotransferase domain-containing protein n=1 Tax=Salinibacillus aidingensis TaxID=237684 RepID=A0ABP3KT81_9BACI